MSGFLLCPIAAQATDGGGTSLGQQSANPISSLISLPFQFDYNGKVGPARKGEQVVLDVEPIIPIHLSKQWNLLSRTILPVVWQKDVAPGSGRQFGLSDTTQSFFLTPADAKGFIWGIGPVAGVPTGKNRLLTSGKWAAGPTGVIVIQTESGLTYGALANHLWSVAGKSNRPSTSNSFLEPFFNKTTKSQFSYGILSEIGYDWKLKHWVAPLILNLSQVVKIGEQAVSIGGALRYYVATNETSPHGLGGRITINFLFPEKKK